ncbi:MAG TPA: hypothetical protein VFS02_13280 [Telluria sp.]|nr:hypothetical protein [Telluria sp.]
MVLHVGLELFHREKCTRRFDEVFIKNQMTSDQGTAPSGVPCAMGRLRLRDCRRGFITISISSVPTRDFRAHLMFLNPEPNPTVVATTASAWRCPY